MPALQSRDPLTQPAVGDRLRRLHPTKKHPVETEVIKLLDVGDGLRRVQVKETGSNGKTRQKMFVLNGYKTWAKDAEVVRADMEAKVYWR